MIIKHANDTETNTDKLSDVEALIMEKGEELRNLCYNARRQCVVLVDSRGAADGHCNCFWNMSTQKTNNSNGDLVDNQQWNNIFSMVNAFVMQLSGGKLGVKTIE